MLRAAALSTLVTLIAAPGAASAETPEPMEVCIQPLGPHNARALAAAERGIEQVYGFSVRRLPRAPLPDTAYYKPRRRYRADKLLDHLDGIAEEQGCSLVLGFTSKDISTTKGKHRDWGIFGLGTIGGPSSVVSTHRLRRRAGYPLLVRRTVKVVNHELGHTLGIEHIPAKGCLMQDAAGTIVTVDTEAGLLCESTRRRIEAAHSIRLPTIDAIDWKLVVSSK